MTYYDNFGDLSLCNAAISASAANQKVFVNCKGVERKISGETFYTIPGFITVLKILVI